MLLRAVAPYRVVKDLVLELDDNVHRIPANRVIYAMENGQTLGPFTAAVDDDTWYKLLFRFQATPEKLEGEGDYYERHDVIWVADVTSDTEFLCNGKIGIFIHQKEAK